jgi:hypothetical protein
MIVLKWSFNVDATISYLIPFVETKLASSQYLTLFN